MDEVVHKSSEESALSKPETANRTREEMRCIDLNQILILLLVLGHSCDESYSQTQTHVCLDDV